MERPSRRHPCRDSESESIIIGECKGWEREGDRKCFEAGVISKKAKEDDLEWQEGLNDFLESRLDIPTRDALSSLGQSDEVSLLPDDEQTSVGSFASIRGDERMHTLEAAAALRCYPSCGPSSPWRQFVSTVAISLRFPTTSIRFWLSVTRHWRDRRHSLVTRFGYSGRLISFLLGCYWSDIGQNCVRGRKANS